VQKRNPIQNARLTSGDVPILIFLPEGGTKANINRTTPTSQNMLTLGASRQPITTGRMEDTGEVIPLPW
jgi:hypothetical protein